jgi:peptidyl-prolyl cis-trans isomerase SurA
MRSRGSGVALAALLLAASAWAETPPPAPPGNAPGGMVLDRVVASVNDEAVTLSEVQEEGQPVIRKLFQDFVGPEREKRLEEAQKRLLDDLIDRRLMYQEAKREGTLPSSTEIQGAIEDLKKNNNVADDAQFRALLKAEGLTLEQVRRSVAERLAIGRLLARQVRSSILLSEDEMVKYYEAHPEKFQRTPEAQIHHLLVAIGPARDEAGARARAEEALAKIRAGAAFSAAAEEYSDAPAGSGAETLTVHRGDLAPEIEAAAFGLPVGQVSGLIRTAAGWHILKVERVRAEPVAPYAEVRETIREQLFQDKFEVKRKDWLAALRTHASIHVFIKEGEMLGAPQTQTP